MEDSSKLITEDDIKREFKELMLAIKAQRSSKFPLKGKQLAERLSKTVNYMSAVENGKEFPSMKLFINYLLLFNFDLTPLKNLKILDEAPSSSLSGKRLELIEKSAGLNEAQLDFLLEQLKISEVFKLKQKN